MEKTIVPILKDDEIKGMQRRKFLGILGGSASVIAVAAACNNDDDNNAMPYDGAVVEADGTVNLGRGDVGILNYAFALEQLEAAFYTQVIQTPYSGITSGEQSLLTDIRDHEVAHREFLKAALGTKGIPALEVNFSSIDFTSKTSVMQTAQAFEDLGVSAYNGAGKLIVSPDYLLLAGKIVSVEARHAAYIRDMNSYGSFGASDVVDTSGLDVISDPNTVLNTASTYLTTKVSGSNLPTM